MEGVEIPMMHNSLSWWGSIFKLDVCCCFFVTCWIVELWTLWVGVGEFEVDLNLAEKLPSFSMVNSTVQRQRRSKELGTGHPDVPIRWKTHSQPPFGCVKKTFANHGISTTYHLNWWVDCRISGCHQQCDPRPNCERGHPKEKSPKDSTLGRFFW